MDDPASTNAKNDIDMQPGHIRKVDCVIIGAGAAGLQCAVNLLDYEKNISVVILEARDRVGGRILTTDEIALTVCSDSNLKNEVLFHRDHGAAWVHGAHKINPMMQLLAEIESESDRGLLPMLDPVFNGNMWTRPHTILHGNDKRRGQNSLISFFVDGVLVPDSDTAESDDEIEQERCIIRDDIEQEPLVASSSSLSSSISRAIRRHYQVLRAMMLKYDNGEYNDNDNVDQLYHQLNSTLADGAHDPTERGEDKKRLVDLLAPFYLFLMENWNGISMNDTNVEQIVECLVPMHKHHDDDGKVKIVDGYAEANVEENKGNIDQIKMPETDEQYVGAGDFIGPHCKVKTGMITVLKPLIRRIEHHQQDEDQEIICLREKVVSIIDKANHVRIEIASGKVVEANCCVNTIPLGCLQNLIANKTFFQPRLRDEKIEAINSFWSGSYKKIFLTFDHIFWPKETPVIGLIRSKPERQPGGSASSKSCTFPGRHLVLFNLWARENIPSIEAILCGDLGKWAFEKSDDIIKQAVIEFIEDSMGICNLSTSCTGCHVTRWEEDEFTRGSYSSFRLNTVESHVDVAGSTEWDGRLVFAGEATDSEHMGSVHAALMSGKRAAREVIDLSNAT
uniref:Amine oxidase domain-containing protein n=1 Tax=Pseudo-nitzschia australis TaxID=44445 RepID=A0A7S4AAR3_9STRA|mmetsp:Transcript_26363/g.57759  ORF Transcript_26363/g.57759 Transcript_26363/m.57759 type:complete len:621 (+) Transcript_26363:76-1938(+)